MNDGFSSFSLRVLQIGWTRLGSWWNYDDLSAPYWRFYWNAEPGAKIMHEGKSFNLDPDKFYLIAPETSFSSHIDGEKAAKPSQFYLHFAIEGGEFDFPSKIFVFKASESAKEQISEIIKYNESEDFFHSGTKALALLGNFLASLSVRISLKTHGGKARKALEILQNHCERGISNAELASKFSMSANSFLRFFRNSFGMSPQKYLRHLRVERACFMLHYSDKNIKEIADSLGFSDRYHFTKVFTIIRGESPGSFRKKKYKTGGFNPKANSRGAI